MNHFIPRAKNLAWFHTAYITDWAVAWACYGFKLWINTMPVFERGFMANDPFINHPHTEQRVNHFLLYTLALFTPLSVICLIAGWKRSLHTLHHGSLGLCLAVTSQSLLVTVLKNRVGRLRPDFLARCKWDESLSACTGNIHDIQDGRRSFPSGHSSLAFAGLTFLSLYLGTHICAFRLPATSTSPLTFFRSRALRLSLALSPLGIATWVAVTRLEDYRHHKEDVITGGSIGVICAYVSYYIYWYSPFSGDPGPRNVYAIDSTDGHPGYELAPLEEPLNNV